MLPQLLLGLGLVGWSWSVVVCAAGFGVGGWRLVSGGLCFWVWGWWVGVGRSRCVLAGMEWVGGVGQWWFVLWGWWVGVGRSWFVREGLGLVGWGWSVVVCALGFGALVAWGWPSLGLCWPSLGAMLVC